MKKKIPAMTPEVILFDLDDTLIVEKTSAEAAFREVSGHVRDKYGVDPLMFQSSVRMNARKVWYSLPAHPYCKKIGISSWEGLWAEFKGEHKMLRSLASYKDYYRFTSWYNTLLEFKINDKDFAIRLSEMFCSERRKRHVLFPETASVLENLYAEYPLGLVTNGAPDLQRTKINGAGLDKYFRHIIISGEVNVGKPDRRIFEIALKMFGVREESTIMVGDSIDTDIAGAAASGIKTVWLKRDSSTCEEHAIRPGYIISDLSGLVPLFK
jgi:putative hydrolase of the HAD superfamily